jgi:hypothetical protein
VAHGSGQLLSAVGPHLDQFVTELHNINDKMNSRDLNDAKESQLKVLHECYDRYPFSGEIRPNFETFICLSTIESLRNSHSSTLLAINSRKDQNDQPTTPPNFSQLLSNDSYKSLLQDEIGTWTKQAIAGARKLLGYSNDRSHEDKQHRPNQKGKKEKGGNKELSKEINAGMDVDIEQSAQNPVAPQPDTERPNRSRKWYKTPGKLDPEFRVTAWFVCNRCQSLESGYRRLGVLDFAGMCAHQCRRPDLSKANPVPWDISEYDQTVITIHHH